MRLLGPSELEEELRRVGAERYHNLHPFHRMLHSGQCDKRQVQAWALNRYYYQSRIPLKDAALIARTQDAAVRRAWRSRLSDHDGENAETGGIAKWLRLTDGLGIDRGLVASEEKILPATRFAVDAYVHFVSEHSLLEAIASSLTELFSPKIIEERVSGMLRHYEFVDADTLEYFTDRFAQASRDSEFALGYVKAHAVTPQQQQQVLSALRFKCDVLWAMLDALHFAYVEPGYVPPGCFGAAR